MTDASSTTTRVPVRNRLLDAMAQCLSDRGYRATTVADVVRVARTSRRSFYAEFDDKQHCFTELLVMTNGQLADAIAAGVDSTADWTTQVRQAVTSYVSVCEENPHIVLSWIRELPALGETARPIQVQAMETIIAVLVPLTDSPALRRAGIAPITHDTAVIIWGGIRELAATALEQGRPLRSIVEPAVSACVALIGANIGSQEG